jgi:hypothetical protein
MSSRNPKRLSAPKLHEFHIMRLTGSHAGELSSQVFNSLTQRIIAEMHETVESQINDASNRRQHAIAQMDDLKAEIDKAFLDFEGQVRRHQEKVHVVSEAVRKKVEADTKEMMALSQRLRTFADNVNTAHDMFFSAERQ